MITNKKLNKHYIGVRSTDNEPVNDLGKKYFSSSTDKEFINDQKAHPENYQYKVLKEFSTRKEAEQHEIELHKKYNVAVNENFYNKAISTNMGYSVEGTKWSEEHRKHMEPVFEKYRGHTYEERFGAEKAKEIKSKQRAHEFTPEHCKHISEAKMGVKLSEYHREAIAKGTAKRYENEEFKKKFDETMTKVNQSEWKRKDDSEKLKALWANPETRARIWGDRARRTSYVIRVTYPNGDVKEYKGFEKMCKNNNFSKHIVREALKTGEVIGDYSKFSHNNNYVYLEGYKFEKIGVEK